MCYSSHHLTLIDRAAIVSLKKQLTAFVQAKTEDKVFQIDKESLSKSISEQTDAQSDTAPVAEEEGNSEDLESFEEADESFDMETDSSTIPVAENQLPEE